MTDLAPTYAFEDDTIYAIVAGRVVAEGPDLDAVETEALKHVTALKAESDREATEESKRTATHIITPNGVKGQLLGRTASWSEGEEVTARFENGQIATFTVSEGDSVQFVNETKTAGHRPNFASVAELQEILDAAYEHDKDSLSERIASLKAVASMAHRMVLQGTSYAHEVEYDKIKTAATHEAAEAQTALDYLESADAEAFAPPEHTAQVYEQASLGHGASDNWLEVTAQEMVAETEATDFEKLLAEEPVLFVTELETGTLADAGSTREMAYSHIAGKTAGLVGTDIDEYNDLFVARVEVARRNELADRTKQTKTKTAAKVEQESTAPDEALFL